MKVTTGISVRAKEVINNGDGVFTIIVEGEELPPTTLKMIRDMFPHTADKVHDLLAVEAVIGSIEHDYVPNPENPVDSERVKHKKGPLSEFGKAPPPGAKPAY